MILATVNTYNTNNDYEVNNLATKFGNSIDIGYVLVAHYNSLQNFH